MLNLKNNYRLKLILAIAALFLAISATIIAYRLNQAEADILPGLVRESPSFPSINYQEGNFVLRIDKLSIFAPVIADVDGSDKGEYFAALQKGVAQMKGTVSPDKKGNMVIFGHSNFYADDPGAFKQVFKNLDELKAGDKIFIRHNDKDYNYAVSKQQIVNPEDTWVISAPYDLTLLTCWPPGTIEKRLIIFANKI